MVLSSRSLTHDLTDIHHPHPHTHISLISQSLSLSLFLCITLAFPIHLYSHIFHSQLFPSISTVHVFCSVLSCGGYERSIVSSTDLLIDKNVWQAALYFHRLLLLRYTIHGYLLQIVQVPEDQTETQNRAGSSAIPPRIHFSAALGRDVKGLCYSI